MSSIWGSSASDIYVVGHNSENAGMMYHFDGRKWARVPLTMFEGGPIQGAITLSSIYGFASCDIWAVGARVDSIEQSTGRFKTSLLTIHWDGKKWSELPVIGHGILAQIDGLATNDVYAVGGESDIILHWDGTSWRKSTISVPTQGVGFASIANVSRNEAYTVGFINDVTAPTDTGSYYLYRFDGTSWSRIDSVIITLSYVGPIRFGEKLFAMKGVLYSSFGNGIQRYDGGAWTTILNDSRVMYMGGNDANNLYAVGSEGTAYWSHGTTWTRLVVPGGSSVTLVGAWTDGRETIIIGHDVSGHLSYVYHGK
ncbi:MAG: hypothetical protein M1378_10195 [Bacteroidetes bacterium]|nr:hypothetical protein [Bacteroidota bacterium]